MTTPPTDTTPTAAEIALLSRMEAAMKRSHDVAPQHSRWTETAKAALAVMADWQDDQKGRETV